MSRDLWLRVKSRHRHDTWYTGARRADYLFMATPKPAGIPASALAAQVDELGALEREFAPLRPKLARIEALRKAIRAQFDSAPAAASFEAKGDKFIVQIGPRAMERTYNPAKLIKAIGLKAYAMFARATLGDLEKNVAPDIVAAVVTAENTGTRPLKTFERGL